MRLRFFFQWDSFKSLVKGKTGAKKTGKVKISAVVVERRRRSDTKEEIPQQITSSSRRSDSFTLSDFTAQTLAEQLCLIEQVCMYICIGLCGCSGKFHRQISREGLLRAFFPYELMFLICGPIEYLNLSERLKSCFERVAFD